MNKAVIVTGATGYFGKYIVEELANTYTVIATSRSEEKLNTIFPGDKVVKVAVDLNDTTELVNIVEGLCTEYDVCGVVNNAFELSPKTGFNTEEGNLDQIKPEMLSRAFNSGVLAPFVIAQECGKQMIKKGIKGSIVNISSMYGLVSPSPKLYEGKTIFNPISYGIMKSGVDAMTRYIASFWGEHGIRCNSVAPGPFPNVETVTANSTKDDEFLKRLENKTCLNKVGHPKDLLGVIKLLLSDDAGFITGQTISVDGGWTIT